MHTLSGHAKYDFEQTAFHASFTDDQRADRAVLKVSRGTSVVSSHQSSVDLLLHDLHPTCRFYL